MNPDTSSSALPKPTTPRQTSAQPALGFYAWSDEDGGFRPFALNVLSLDGERVRDVTAFIARSPQAPSPESYERYPEQPVDPARLGAVFGRFGLPERLD